MDKNFDSLLNEIQNYKIENKSNLKIDNISKFITNIKELLLADFLLDNYNSQILKLKYLEIKESVIKLLIDSNLKDPIQKGEEFMSKLAEIRHLLLSSANSIYKGDPSSNSIQEIVLTFPGFQAIFNYRIAHQFYLMGATFLARIISELAHQTYGIDINPGAKIGESFFIDHGTGIVIGETSIIGNNVKIYQGVTLGALSLKEGQSLKGSKRHPTILDNVTIYSNASIFGGNTIIGQNSTIGANTYITSSIEPDSIVILNKQGMTITCNLNNNDYII